MSDEMTDEERNILTRIAENSDRANDFLFGKEVESSKSNAEELVAMRKAYNNGKFSMKILVWLGAGAIALGGGLGAIGETISGWFGWE